ncbi:uncharacterized protein MONOS_18616 [Monocercomonoides exilis]|uniref:uncharacterized protein n=1 Tax=Monocercomonoides exilis TaxID=2049356 RepID=UPI003559F254|nr:hypothetical protein MONOS_18616 [Monocercomonoides exilis]
MCNDEAVTPVHDYIKDVMETQINMGSNPILSVYKKVDSNVEAIVPDILSPNLLDYHFSNDYYQPITCHNSHSFHDDVAFQVSNEERGQNRVQSLHPHHSISKNFTSPTDVSSSESSLISQPLHNSQVSSTSFSSSSQSKSNNTSEENRDNFPNISFHDKHVHHSPTNRKDTNAPKNASSNNFETIHSNNHSINNISKHVPNESIDSSKLSFSTRNPVNNTDIREIGKTLIPSHEQENLQCSKQPIRIINVPKSELYEKFVKETKIKMSKSQFYKRTLRLKRATRRTDVCDLCEVYSSLKNKEKLLFQRSDQLNNEEKATKQLIEKHRILANNQQQFFRHLKNNLTQDEALLLFDYKENWSLPIRKNQISRDFYNKVEVSQFCVIAYLKDENENKVKHIFNFFSNVLSHNFKFTIECLQQVLFNPIFEKKKVFRFMCDTGSHFRNSQLMHFLLSNNSSFAKDKTISLSFFCEKHGKCECDGEFGHLSQCINNKLDNNTVIGNIDELIKFFEIYSCHTGSCDDNHISNCSKTHRNFLKHNPSNKILWKKMVVSSLKTYLFYEKRGN